MRHLIYVPIIHTEADLGSMAEFLKNEFKKKYPDKKYEEHIDAIKAMWDGIVERFDDLDVDWNIVKLYQDGLPVCGREEEIVSDLAQKGSLNHKLLVDLMSRGAGIQGTEDRELLLKEYDYLQRIFKTKSQIEKNKVIKEYQLAGKSLLEKRDRFIAQRIDQTLKMAETGILFMGMLHRVDKYLPESIVPRFLIHRLPFDNIPHFARK